ncbi:restriction endonuclease (plasmid) [Sphingomonas changnyeongensis]|uniref:Restriction endonuclease n=1 Tax=Sphingomonas changnyeongensis TaxID=2698679 RepID=A0A7Z2NYZ1_9SPHN|nr:HNH endonuclease [Sphingomonas changnyeongensis]QHL92006.1 restriction endonuclease [Sphingomonas changnyeongensis]
MARGVFVHRTDSIYDDSPAERYQFPRQYLSRVSACIGDWIVYYEPRKVPGTRGYFAVAKVANVIPDPTAKDMFLALIEPGTYLDFPNPVPFNGPDGLPERGVLNEHGKISGRAQSAVRPLSIEDFNRIIDRGLAEDPRFLPRFDDSSNPAAEEHLPPIPLEIERDRVANLGSRLVRDRLFRRRVVEAYDARCAVTGLRLINGGGRAEVEAAHIRPVESGGPDIVTNGLALSGTVHWMFDRGLIGLGDNLEILVSRQANDAESIRSLINRTGFLIPPQRQSDRPHPAFLAWHRENCFKQ